MGTSDDLPPLPNALTDAAAIAETAPHTRPPQPRPLRNLDPTAVEPHVEQLATVGELMLGAAYADGERAVVEVVAICEQLKKFVEAELLPTEVRRRMDRFDPDAFDVVAACQRLTFVTVNDRLALMNMVAMITGADRIIHEGERAYLELVASAIGLDPESLDIRFT